MSVDEKQYVRERVKNENWNILWAAGEIPLPNQVVRILFQLASGGIAETDAVCHWGAFEKMWFEGESRPYRGNRMMDVLAWKADTLRFLND